MTVEVGVALAVAAAGLIGSMYAAIRTPYLWGERIGKIELKVDTMWEWTLKANVVDAHRHGILIERSAVQLDTRLAAQFEQTGLGPEIRRYYDNNGLASLKESELTFMIARVFGEDLLTKICLPLQQVLHVTLGDALIAAVYLCREGVGSLKGGS